jgi:hypothetical protein
MVIYDGESILLVYRGITRPRANNSSQLFAGSYCWHAMVGRISVNAFFEFPERPHDSLVGTLPQRPTPSEKVIPHWVGVSMCRE